MARQARKRSETGIYHIMLRGIDKRNTFLDKEDRIKFLEQLFKAKETAEFKLYGYCLMDNHVHLLIQESEEIGTSIKRLTVGYVQWHNNKYARTGHLFQNRYMSEVVETEEYLISVLRYIHQNPVKAKMVKNCTNYLWSSYNEYISVYKEGKPSIDCKLVKSYFIEKESFEEYMNANNKDEHLEYIEVKKHRDEVLKEDLKKEIKTITLKEISMVERNRMIKDIYISTGASIRQLGRVLGIGKNIIEKAIKQDE